MLQGFRLAEAFKGSALRVFDEGIDAVEDFAVGLLPIEILLPGMFREDEFHSTNSRSVPPPDSNSATDARRRRAFLGLRKR
jgi:hypothetical protein